MNPVITVEDISKYYHISHQNKASYNTLKDDFTDLLKRPLGRRVQEKHERFWALKDINFEVNQGEAFGIVGQNGSGKSTLLKILSRIVDPTTGKVKMTGRVASLLEVGTGFHPELTGRENIFFNGSMLGMSRQEIRQKFDDIVDFSGVERFLDTPVKFYSSGMYVRLAFAVAAHLDPEILIIDEVLAVGDAQFQRKCIDRMMSITKEGRTILFVSHSMVAVEELCDRAMLLKKGKIKLIGKSSDVAEEYLGKDYDHSLEINTFAEEEAKKSKKELVKIPIASRKDRQGTGGVKFIKLSIENDIKEKRQLKIRLALDNKLKRKFENFKISLDFFNEPGTYFSNVQNHSIGKKVTIEPGLNKIAVTIDKVKLAPGIYYINCFAAADFDNSEIFDWVQSAISFKVPEYDYYRTGKTPVISSEIVYMDYRYEPDYSK